MTSELWVMAYIRRLSAEAIPAMIVRKGDAERGAVWVKLATLDGKATLYGPEPAGFDARQRDERRFIVAAGPSPETDIDTRAKREAEFDGDIWLVEIEDRKGRHLLGDALRETS